MPNGYAGKILRVNLTTGELAVEELDERFYRTYMGGWGLIAHFLLKELPTGVDPLGPENMLIFATGVVTGTPVAGAGRSAVGAKSPLTGGFGEADVGGWWGAELAHAGFDAIIFSGKSAEPVYLWVKDGQAELRSAAHLWGKLTADVEAALREELEDKRVRVAQIGPAGERLSRIAGVMHDINRAAGRTGLGAVMGSKNLKAVAVRGTGKKEIADQQSLQDVARWFVRHYPSTWGASLKDLGTANAVTQHLDGGLPTLNFQRGTFDGWEAITGKTMRDTVLKDRDTCYACPIGCKRVVEITEGDYQVDPVYGGPEYETLGALGSICGVDDLAAICKANELCNAYGLDTISCGMTIGWAMECFDRGLLTTEDTGGLDLRFGDAAAMVKAVELMGQREGFGDLLAEGAYRAAGTIGRGTDAYVIHAKKQELPMHEPRIKYGLGVGYALSPTGADHMHNFHDVDYQTEDGIEDLQGFGILEPLPFNDLSPAKMRLGKVLISWQTLHNSLGFCMFVGSCFTKDRVVQMVRAITGWDTSLYELIQVGER
ncbi:MAG: aldehyde ferredoxin oxidoreductase family protein, partial [Chloroflexi bacterium]|nr:aldehyde ferredoxin oxidoreductase family protein [Chloroflexota bacterium]